MFDIRPSHSILSPARIRLAAQARILAARKLPFITVRVYGPDDEVRIDTTIGGYIGDISSNIVYDLEPDKGRWPGNRDQSGPPQAEWITGIEDLMDERTPPNDRSRERSWAGVCEYEYDGDVVQN
ncbi:hypothetical protein N0V94_002181 [Neodidymelliopsis sp. IMI 364377]|nr:hypothetical protein N0V94_002181 [Neodidymelliopsis sp. IMI 364377]